MKILFGTTNQGKLDNMRKILGKIDVEVIGLNDLELDIPFVDETGETPLENARLKSKAYFKAFGYPVFSYDSGLYFVDEAKIEQPATYVRRYQGYEMNDDEMIEHYSRIAEDNGGKIKAQYINGISFVVNDEVGYEYQGDEISVDPFYITSIPHSRRIEGFPLNTISMEIESGQYFYDVNPVEKRGPSKWEKRILNFFQRSLELVDYNK